MEKIKVYRNISTKELVAYDDAQEFAMDKLGITIQERGNNGTYTQDQIDFLGEFTEWYFSDNWVTDFVDDNEIY